MNEIAWRIACAPLGKIQRKMWKRRCRNLSAHPAHIPDNRIRRWVELGVFFAIFVQKPTDNAVAVCGHEIDPNTALLDVIQKLWNPGGPGSCRSPDPQRGVESLNGLCCQIVKIEIGLLVGIFPET